MKFDIVRAWKDETYRQSLSEEQLSALPANPAGQLELTEADLPSVSGGVGGIGDILKALNGIEVTTLAILSDLTKSTCA